MQHEIGELSGKVWKVLDEKGNMTLTQLKKSMDENEFMLGAALGWLAREDKVTIEKSARTVKIALK